MNKILILGLPIDNLDLQETVEAILNLIDVYKKDSIPKYVATVNSDFLANAWGWSSYKPSNPELLRILRITDLTTADGMPLVWLSKWLGNPLKERVTGQDLFPLLLKELDNAQLSVYLLGGEHGVAWKAADKIKKEHPHLHIAGISDPIIYTKGESLENAAERDLLILEDINKSAPDVLLIQLGNPKQEIWFDRVRNHLKVPVSIGIGGSFERYVGTVSRAPRWMQKIGLEWFYRLIKEPKRLWKRYAGDFFKMSYYSIPLVLYQKVNNLVYYFNKNQQTDFVIEPNSLFISPHLTLSVIKIPTYLNEGNAEELMKKVDESKEHDVIVFDFQKMRNIDLEGLYILFKAWRKLTKTSSELYGLFINEDMKFYLKRHRIWDFFSGNMYESPQDILIRAHPKQRHLSLLESVHHDFEENVVVEFFGRLGNQHDYEQMLHKLIPMLQGKDCHFSFKYCTEIDNAGFAFLLQLKNHQERMGQKLILQDISKTLRHQFEQVSIKI